MKEFTEVRQKTVDLCSPLKTEDYVSQPVAWVSPPKWNLGHTTWFFEEVILKPLTAGYSPYDKNYSYLFNSYYNSLGARTPRAERGTITRPTVDEVYAYRQYVDSAMVDVLKSGPSEEVLRMVTLGLNHEQQHQELFVTDLKYTLSLNPLFPVYREGFDLVSGRNRKTGWTAIGEGVYEIGSTGEGFCYDNELQRHKVYLRGFEIRKDLVTNAEYREFIEDGGYERFDLWLDEGWTWVQTSGARMPLYWHARDGEWSMYTLSGLKKLQPDAMLAHVSFYEASAFARWKGARLPTEAEWEIAADGIPWGDRWEWTNSAYLPYPGFVVQEGPVGEYNGKFMVNQMVLRGASVATADGHSRKTYRNFFHPHVQWQFSGIRLARDTQA